MPSKNSIKEYAENTFYHVYNRGVEKRRIFYDRQDYNKFLDLIAYYLNPIEKVKEQNSPLRTYFVRNNLSDALEVHAFCLMPNHFHFLIKQKNKDAITRLMRQVSTGYSMYFNKRYERVGPLFQGRFKACIVDKNEYLLHLSRYIHQNPLDRGVVLSEFEWSSYPDYVGDQKTNWVKTDFILNYFKENSPNTSYQKFVDEKSDNTNISNLIIE